MCTRKFLTIGQKVTQSCWSLAALAVLAAPGLAWGQDCNDTGSIVKTPGGVYSLGEKVNVKYNFGSSSDTTAGLVLTVNDNQVYVALDCVTALSGGDREECLGFDGAGLATAADDGDAIAYAGNLTFGNVTGDACTGLTFSLPGNGDGDPVEPDPNILTFLASGPIQLDPGDSCFVAFDAYVNSIGLPANWETPGNQFINAASGFTGSCGGNLGASSTKSTAYEVAITPLITLRKEVCLADCGDEANWYDANVGPFPTGVVPGSTAMYRLIVENTGEEPLANVVFTDDTPPFFLGLTDVALPDRCYVDGYFPVGDICTIVSGDSGFGALGNPPVAVCATAGTKTNLACVDAEGGATGDAVNACDPANVVCIEPGIDVTKDGPALAKIGDTITYSICADNTGATDLNNCKVTDALLSLSDAAFPNLPVGATNVCLTPAPTYLIPGDAGDPLVNTATVTCDVVGSASATVNDSDGHSVNLFTTAIDVRKDGPTEAKAGDTIDYDICATNLSSTDAPEFDSCTVTDSLLGLDGAAFPVPAVDGSEVCLDPQATYTIPTDASGSVDNRADVTCTFAEYDNEPSDFDTHSVPLFTVTANMTKECRPDPVAVGEDITWEITINNTGDKDIDCLVIDDTAGYPAPGELLSVPAGGSDSLTPSRTVVEGDGPTISNTATASCTVAASEGEYDNSIDLGPETADCEIPPDVDEICRTPGFWGTHAGEEKEGRSTNLTQEVIDFNGGSLGTICGEEITNTSVNDYTGAGSYPGNGDGSAVEGICVHPKGAQVRQLMRQLIAASLNCVVSGGGADCTGVSIYDDFTDANAACAANAGDLSQWIGIIDDFNNGVGSTCHDRNLTESDVFDGVSYKVPGPAGSSRACSAATKNDFYHVP